MSYSFKVQGKDKRELVAKVVTELNKVVADQPAHRVDHDPVRVAVAALARTLADDSAQDVMVTVSGSITKDDKLGVQMVSCNIAAQLVKRAGAPPGKT